MRAVFILVISLLVFLPFSLDAEETEYLEYTIKKGDTLWDVTGGKLTDPFLWPKVWKENPEIKNPDLIYPGQKLRIPLYLLQKQIDIKPVAEKVVTEELPEPLVIPPRHPFVVKGDLIAASGYIDDEIPRVGRVVSTPTGRTIIGRDDFAYIELFNGSITEDENRFYTIRSLGMIEHPTTKEDIGYLIELTGIVEVIGKEAGFIKTAVIKSFSEIHIGDYLDEYYPIESFPIVKGTTPSIHGTIVASRELRILNGIYDIVYLDRGSTDGMMLGNVFTLISANEPHRPIAKIQIISARQKTAVAMIIKSEVEVSRGDYF